VLGVWCCITRLDLSPAPALLSTSAAEEGLGVPSVALGTIRCCGWLGVGSGDAALAQPPRLHWNNSA
jgi:hypothetical protein